MRYGALPIVRRVGGLADTVTGLGLHGGTPATGFLFEDPDKSAMIDAIGRAIALFHEPLTWRRMQLNAMTQDFSRGTGAAKYLSLYRSLVSAQVGTGVRRRARLAQAAPPAPVVPAAALRAAKSIIARKASDGIAAAIEIERAELRSVVLQ